MTSLEEKDLEAVKAIVKQVMSSGAPFIKIAPLDRLARAARAQLFAQGYMSPDVSITVWLLMEVNAGLIAAYPAHDVILLVRELDAKEGK